MWRSKLNSVTVSDLKSFAFMSKNALECLLFYIVTFLCCVKERMGPPAAFAGQIPVCLRLMFLERAGEGMKQRRLIETKSTPLPLLAAILFAEDTCCR